ncbi:pilus assembly protein [Alicyclobacillus curvatus]|nr:pilus assembly protein [Alicyclobacillus curvatus]
MRSFRYGEGIERGEMWRKRSRVPLDEHIAWFVAAKWFNVRRDNTFGGVPQRINSRRKFRNLWTTGPGDASPTGPPVDDVWQPGPRSDGKLGVSARRPAHSLIGAHGTNSSTESHAGEGGQSLVEFALVLPVLLLLLLGIIDFGRVLSAYYVVDHAARDAARYASIGASDSTVIQAIQSDTAALTGTPNYTISPTAVNRLSGNPVTVTVSVPVQIIDPVMAAILGSTYTASATVQMRIE